MSNEGHSAVHMLRCLNPMTHSIHYVPHNNQVAPLQHLCHIAVRRNITVKRFNQVKVKLLLKLEARRKIIPNILLGLVANQASK